MELSQNHDRVACGIELGALVDQVAEGVPPTDPGHQAGCRHCQAALAELEPLWGRVRELAREEVSVPAALAAIVIRTIREQLPDDRSDRLPLEEVVPRLLEHALLLDERGTTRIADTVIAQVVAREALATPGVSAVARGGAVRAAAGGGVTVAVDGHRVSLHLSLVVTLGSVIPDVVAGVRARVVDVLERLIGLEAVAIDITVAEIREQRE